jgi:NitT/TauT family transport system ATP-binding protein
LHARGNIGAAAKERESEADQLIERDQIARGVAKAAKQAIVLSGISKSYAFADSLLTALAPTDLTVASGEMIILLGPSGCGKTTLLRLIGGLIEPTTGSVSVFDHPLWKSGARQADALSDLGMVFQDANLFPWLTVEQNIALPLELRGVKRATRAREAARLIDMVGITGFGNRWPRELSGGMLQRAAIARALSYNPKIMLMDEPFGALNAMTRDSMNLELQRIWLKTGKTIVVVTHSITEAVFLGDRIVLLTARPGQIDTIIDVSFDRPRSIDLQGSAEFQRIVIDLRRRLYANS